MREVFRSLFTYAALYKYVMTSEFSRFYSPVNNNYGCHHVVGLLFLMHLHAGYSNAASGRDGNNSDLFNLIRNPRRLIFYMHKCEVRRASENRCRATANRGCQIQISAVTFHHAASASSSLAEGEISGRGPGREETLPGEQCVLAVSRVWYDSHVHRVLYLQA